MSLGAGRRHELNVVITQSRTPRLIVTKLSEEGSPIFGDRVVLESDESDRFLMDRRSSADSVQLSRRYIGSGGPHRLNSILRRLSLAARNPHSVP